MSNNNMWNDDADVPSEYDMLEEVLESEDIAQSIEDAPHEVYDFDEIDDSIIEEIQDEAAYDLEENEVASVYNVRVRLEQAKLYEMLINHNLFEGVEASKQAINNVQTELKEYIVSRLERLMGFGQPKTEIKEEIIVDQPFNDIEIDFLKALSYKGTQGKSAEGEYTQPEITRVEKLTPVSAAPVKKKPKGLKSLASKPLPKPAQVEKPLRQKPKRKTAKAPAKKAPTKRPAIKARPKTNNRKVTNIEMQKNKVKMTKSQVQHLAEEEIKRENAAKKARGGKNWGQMTQTEKTREIVRANKRNEKPRPVNAAPMPNQDAINMHYQTQQAIRGSKAGGKGQFNVMLANALANNNIGESDE